ncbi:GcrA family cell cycle regulator [Acetobacter okinawensis]|uniref:GcrA cell cycle regulator n=1 Tax=Acetobacter okinawensis TaxID=1076594 RepID=A0A252BV75_9PROT|nr:GcrA family cell cycle regulator [Acetobacter okinawensis]OUJ12830.1 GcrA cell cycle regulator [Acetobacter okinawensis]
MEWSEEIIAQLKDLWAEGLSTAEIGRRLSITKNAVVGKAHRLGLPPRPSPIRRNGSKPKTAADKPEQTTAATPVPETPTPRATGPVAPSVPPVPPAAIPTPAPVAEQAAPAAAAPVIASGDDKAARKEKAAPVARSTTKPKTLLRSISDPEPQKRRGPACCWPIGDPGTPGFHFCGATPIPGKPYCEEHAQIAYVRLRDRRDSVA